MISKDFFQALEDFERERKIPKEQFIEALETALTSAYKKHIGEAKLASVKLNPEKCTLRIYSYKEVKEEVLDPEKEISLEDARLIKKSYKIGDYVEHEESTKDFGRIAAQTAKQVVMQKLRELEKEKMLSDLTEKEDELITGIVRRIEGKNVFVEIGSSNLEAILPEQEQIKGETYYINSKIKVYVKKMKESQGKSFVQVSRANTGFVKKLFELEVPEIANGEVEIKSIAREAGFRTKIAVYASNENIDAVGACVGNRGMRINSIVSEMNGEKVDIILYSDDPLVYVARALSPAQVTSVSFLDSEKSTRAIVPDDKLSLAIGAQGLNVRLAARLTGLKIDVKSESKANTMEKPIINTFDDIETDLDDMFKD